KVAVVAGTSEETEPGSNRFHIIAAVIGADGIVKGRYHRTHPAGPYIYPNGDLWDFHYKEADEFPVFDMGWGKLAMLVCSEVFVPEMARVLALKGAEVCLMHAGLLIDELGYTDNWRTLVRARAIENLMYTATTVHLFPEEFGRKYRQADLRLPPTGSHLTAGIAMIASPERVLCESHEPGILSAVLDLVRIRWLREADEELLGPAPYRTIPGIRRAENQEVIRTAVGVERRVMMDDPERGYELAENRYEPGTSSSRAPLHHQGFEFGFVLEGQLEVTVGDRVHVARTGDAIRLDS